MDAALSETLVDLLATFFVAGRGSREVSDAAVRAMEAGFDTPMLYHLAGLTEWTSASELESMFRRLLAELGVEMPEHRTLVHAMARRLARDFLAGKVTPDQFADGLYVLPRSDCQDGEYLRWWMLQCDWSLARDGIVGTIEEGVACLREEAERLVNSGSGGALHQKR